MSVIQKLQEARDLFECSICKNEYDDPRLLNCNHSFCLSCLQQWSKQRTNQNRRIVCPNCKVVTQISEKHPVEELPKDFKANVIKDAFSGVTINPTLRRSMSGNSLNCDVCANKEAIACCTDCRKQLCTECQAKHEQHSLFKDHTIQSFKDSSYLKCDTHQSEAIKYFCKTCNTAVCTLCALGDHEKHDTGTLAEGLEQCKQSLNVLLKPLGLKKGMLKNALAEAAEIDEQMEKAFIRSKELLERKADAMVAEVQEWESKVERTLQEQYDKCKQRQVQYVSDLTDRTEAIDHLCQDIIASVQDSSNNIHLVSTYGNTMSEFKTLTSSEPQELNVTIPCFKEDIALSDFLENLDVIGIEEVNISDYGDYEQPKQKLQWQVTERSSEIGGLLSPVSVSFSPRQNILVCEVDNNRVQIFDNTGKSMGAIKFRAAKDVLSHPNGQIYLVNAEFPGVIVYDEKGTQIDRWGMATLPSPRSLAVKNNGDIVVADKKTCKITVYDELDGKLLHASDEKLLQCPVSVCTDSSDRIIVADRELNIVQVFDEECKAVFTIAPDIIYQNQEGIHVASVCTDSADNIYVVLHETQKVVKYSPTGQHLADVLTTNDGLAWPTGIAASPGGLLAVVESKVPKAHSALKLFKLY